MTVTKIQPLTKIKYKIFLDGQPAFALYKGELSRYSIAEGQEIDVSRYEEIKAVLLKRAKQRALHLLNAMDRTQEQLRNKLKEGGYPEDVIDQAVAYVMSFGYINDTDYARRFIESRKQKKSRKELYSLLCQKGLGRELVEETLEECYKQEDHEAAIQAIIRKKRYQTETFSETEKKKLCGYLMRKGFAYEDIRHVIQVSEWNA